MVKFVKTNSHAPTHIPSSVQLSTWERLNYIHMIFTLNIFLNQPKFNCFKKCGIFFILITSTNIKIRKTKFEDGCSYKYCNQFLLESLFLRVIIHEIK